MRWLVLGVALLGALARPALAAEPLQRLPGAVHVHSDITTGDFSLEELARMALEEGVGALLLAENYLLQIDYGLPPFYALTRMSHAEPSVLAYGIERYLARVAEVRRLHPELVIVPGVEVIPHYSWTGSPWTLSMTVHNIQKNLLVFGITDPETLRRLPAVGNGPGRRYTWWSVVEAVPGLLVIPGLALLMARRARRVRVGPAIVVVRRRRWLAGLGLAGVGMLALVRGWPFTVDAYPPWRDLGVGPHQALIDHVERVGGATVWSFPEALDSGERWVGPVRLQWLTEPYPDDLLRTTGYAGFGGLYEQATRVVDPGGRWDHLLAQYAQGVRRRPAWAVGESGFHGFRAGKRFGTVQTVFLTRERSEAAVLDALKRGRLYAVFRAPDVALVLEEFSVREAAAAAVSGETLRVARGAPLEVRFAVEASDGGAHPLRVMLVRNGVVAEVWAGTTPFRAVHRETAGAEPLVLRLDVRSRSPHHLLTSPIFVAPT